MTTSMIKYLLAASLLFAPVSATARDVSSDDGNELLALCNDDGYFLQGTCLGIIKGAIVTLDLWAATNKTSPYCRPDGATWGQMQDVVVRYIKRHPETRHESYPLLIAKAQQATWPCSKDVS